MKEYKYILRASNVFIDEIYDSYSDAEKAAKNVIKAGEKEVNIMTILIDNLVTIRKP